MSLAKKKKNLWHEENIFLQLLIHHVPQINVISGEVRHKHFMGNFFPCMHKVLFIPSLQLVNTPMSTCFPFPSYWLVCTLEGTSHSCLVLSHPVAALAAAVRTTKIINWKMTLALNVLASLFSPFKSLCWSEVFSPEVAGCHPGKCRDKRREGKEKVVLVLELNYSKFQNVRLRRAEKFLSGNRAEKKVLEITAGEKSMLNESHN